MPGYELIGFSEKEEVNKVFDSGGILFRHSFDKLRSDCYQVKKFEKNFSLFLGGQKCLAVTSGTAALRVALAALDIGLGDEVITQSFTFVATVEAIVESRATPICANIDETLNLDPKKFEELITEKTKAVILVHMLGVPCDIKPILEICRKYNLKVIEDTAWGCGGSLNNVKLGTWGDIGTYSFDFAKTITTGEGGMLTFKNEEIYNKALAWHDHGHENNPEYPRWEDTRSGSGFNFRMMELQGAIGIAQLSRIEEVIKIQKTNAQKIWDSISDIPQLRKRKEPEGSFSTSDALIFSVDNKELAINIRAELLKEKISTKILPEAITWHFAGTWDHIRPLNEAHKGKLRESLTISEELLSKSVSLPIFIKMNQIWPAKIRECILRSLSR